jgi:hypothetical protein
MPEKTEIVEKPVVYTPLPGQTIIQIWSGWLRNEKDYEKYYSSTEYDKGTVVFENIEVTTQIFAYGFSNEKHLWSIAFINCKLKNLNIRDSHVGSIIIKNTKIEQLTIEGSKIQSIDIREHSSVKSGLTFENSEIKKINARDLTCLFYILKNCTVEEARLVYVKMRADLQLIFCSFNTCIINRCTMTGADVNDLQLKHLLFFIHSEISHLTLNLIKPQKLSFDNVSIFHLQLYRRVIHKDVILEFNDCLISHIDFDSIQNFGYIYFKNILPFKWWKDSKLGSEGILQEEIKKESAKRLIEKKTKITIQNSDLGRTSFIDCDLRLFNRFEFLNSKMLELFIAGSEMPQEIYIPHDYQNSKLLEQKRLGFSQFKSVYEKQGDNIRAWNYKAKELETYRLQLRQQKTFNNLPERFNLGVLKFTSYYNTNWLRPLIFTLIISLFLFSIYCLLLGNTLGKDLNLFWKNFSFVGEFINPIHRAETLENNLRVFPENNISVSLARFVNYLSRIIIAFMVYETIQSFRRHGRRIH